MAFVRMLDRPCVPLTAISSSFDCNVAHMGKRSGAYRVFVRNMRERDHLEHLDIHGKMILKWIFCARMSFYSTYFF
jgi:hypothetical protein